MRNLTRSCLFLLFLTFCASAASAQSGGSAQSSDPPAEPAPAPVAPVETPAPLPLPVVMVPLPVMSTQRPLPAALIPALEARLGFTALARVYSPRNRVLLSGVQGSVTKQASERFGATFEMSYLRASNVFRTGHSSSIFTFLSGPVFYPYRRRDIVASLHVLGGGARAAGVVGLTSGGYAKGTVNDFAWAFGGGLEKWISESLALRVEVDTIHASFLNPSLKPQGEYDMRATWGVTYYLGGRARSRSLREALGE